MKKFKKLICFVLIAGCVLCLAACGKNAAVIETLDDLKGKSVTAQKGTTYIDVIAKDPILSTATLTTAYTETDALAMLYSGSADGAVMSMFSAQRAIHQQEGLRILDGSLDEENFAVAFPKDSAYRTGVNKVINDLKSNGILDDMMFRWLADDAKLPFEQFWAGTNGTLHCLVAPASSTICYIDENGNVSGLEAELILRAARELNMKVEFEIVEFEELIPNLMNGNADCAIGSMAATQKRAILVDFSDTYINGGTVVIVRDANAHTSKALSIKNSFYKTFIENNRWKDWTNGLYLTVLYVVCTFVAFVLFGAVCFLLDYSGKTWVGFICDKITWFFGYLPVSLWIMFFYFAIFAPIGVNGFISGWISMTVAFGAGFYCDIRDAIGSVDSGQVDAAISMGYSKTMALKKIYLPQAISQIVGAIKGRLVNLVKASSLLEFIAVIELQMVADTIRAEANEPFLPLFACAIIYWGFAYIASTLIDKIKVEGLTRKLTEEELIEKYVKDEKK